jgi:hypothetical protein
LSLSLDLLCFTGQIETLSGPNGNIAWLNCGINSGSGWQPSNVTIDQLIAQDLSTALSNSSSPFQNCKDFIDLFQQYGQEYGSMFSIPVTCSQLIFLQVPSIMLASFAMQESSCTPQAVGGGGEQGLMQLTSDKCGGAPNGNCKDPVRNTQRKLLITFSLTFPTRSGLQYPYSRFLLCWTVEAEPRKCSVKHRPVQRLVSGINFCMYRVGFCL